MESTQNARGAAITASTPTRIRLDRRVVALGALRFPVPGHEAVMYEGTSIDGTPEEQHRAVEQIFRQSLISGEIRDNDYALLDGYDVDGDIVCDYGIPTRRQFQFLYRKCNWSVSRLKEDA